MIYHNFLTDIYAPVTKNMKGKLDIFCDLGDNI